MATDALNKDSPRKSGRQAVYAGIIQQSYGLKGAENEEHEQSNNEVCSVSTYGLSPHLFLYDSNEKNWRF